MSEDEIKIALSEIKSSQASLQEDVHHMREKLHHVDVAIRGNGQPGLRAQYMSIQERVDMHRLAFRWLAGILTTVGTAVIVWVITSS